MGKRLRSWAMIGVVLGLSATTGANAALAAGGSPPNGPIDAVVTGSDLKFACSQEIEGSKDVVGEQFYRWMLMVQCRAVVGAIVTMIEAGQFALDGSPRWQCVTVPDDLRDLSATFVTWVGRRPPLMREPAAVAFVEAIELSAPCQSS